MIIRIVYDLDSRQVIDVLSSGLGQTYTNENLHGFIQGEAEKIIPQALSFMIQAAPILTFMEANNIDIGMIQELKQVYKDQTFGQQILNEFIAGRKSQQTEPDEDLLLMDKNVLGDVRELLYDGSIRSAMLKLQSKPEQIIPAEVKAYFVDKMQTYLDAQV